MRFNLKAQASLIFRVKILRHPTRYDKIRTHEILTKKKVAREGECCTKMSCRGIMKAGRGRMRLEEEDNERRERVWPGTQPASGEGKVSVYGVDVEAPSPFLLFSFPRLKVYKHNLEPNSASHSAQTEPRRWQTNHVINKGDESCKGQGT